MPKEIKEKRSESRTTVDKYYSLEFSKEGMGSVYQFKIWNLSAKGMCVLVKEDSELLEYLEVGEVMDMKYYSSDASKPTEYLKTEIKHITKDDEGQFKGHFLIGLSILDE